MPRTVRVKVYKFNELSEKAKHTAIENYRSKGYEPAWRDENRESMEKFAAIFPIHVSNWSYGGRGEGVDFYFTADHDEVEELTGQRLATYLWNNYKNEIFSKKYYRHLKEDSKPILHRNVQREQIQTGERKGKWMNAYYSGTVIEEYNCPLTGYCMDNELLDEIWKFIKKPDARTFKELLQDCFDNWIKACNNDDEEQNSDEYISDHLEANGYEFLKDGEETAL